MNELNKYIQINVSKDIDTNRLELTRIKHKLRRILELVPENSSILFQAEQIQEGRLKGEINIACPDFKLSSGIVDNKILDKLFSELSEVIKAKILVWNSNRVFRSYLKDMV